MLKIKIFHYKIIQRISTKLLQHLVAIHGGSSRRLVELHYQQRQQWRTKS